MPLIRNFTTDAYSPRADSRSVQYRDAKLSLAYSILSKELPRGPPERTRFNMLFVHGTQYNKEAWYYIIEKCFEIWGSQLDKCIAFDHVQHGDSAVLNESKVGFFVPWEDLGRDAACIIRDCIKKGEIHRDSPLILVGHSMGGTGAMALSVFEPGLISAMIVVDPVWLGPALGLETVDAISGRFSRMAFSSYKRTQDTFPNFEEYRKYIDTKSVYANIHPRIKEAVLKSLYVVSPDGTVRVKMSRTHQAAAYYSGLSAVGIGESLVRRIKTPTLVIHGDNPDFNPPGLNEILEEVLYKAERKLIPGAGHLVCYTHPDECVNAFQDFVTREYKNSLDHYDEVEKQWGPSAEEKYLAQVDFHDKGNRVAVFSRL